MRWQHPTQALLAPDEFLPIAENNRAHPAADPARARTALGQCRAGGPQSRTHVAVNLSVTSLLDEGLATTSVALLDQAGVAAERLVTGDHRDHLMADPSAPPDSGRAARPRRRLSVDDYGTGHCSLAYLRDLPVHELKLDRSSSGTSPPTRATRRSSAPPSTWPTRWTCSWWPRASRTPDGARALSPSRL